MKFLKQSRRLAITAIFRRRFQYKVDFSILLKSSIENPVSEEDFSR